MPIVLGDTSGLAQGLQTGFSALAQGLERRAESRLANRQQGALQSALSTADLQTQEGQQKFLEETTAAGIPTQESLGILDRAIKQQNAGRQGFAVDDPEQLSGLFERLGVPEDTAADYAHLYGNLSQGGRTAFAKMFIENLQRGQFSKTQEVDLGQMRGRPQEPQDPQGFPNVEAEEENFVFPELELFSGLTPKEKVSREKDLFNSNAKEFNEISGKAKGLRNDAVRMDTLERYNESGKLPEGMENLNINWKTGDIRFPKLANAETQGFVKTVNDFTIKAKETFGARVTNFELGAFMKRLPTLANSTEGRRQIISTMKAMGDLDALYYDSLKEVYDNYGLRGVDNQKAEKIAEELRASKEDVLKQQVADATQAQEVYELKLSLPPDHVLIEYKGERGGVPQSDVDEFVRKGARLL